MHAVKRQKINDLMRIKIMGRRKVFLNCSTKDPLKKN